MWWRTRSLLYRINDSNLEYLHVDSLEMKDNNHSKYNLVIVVPCYSKGVAWVQECKGHMNKNCHYFLKTWLCCTASTQPMHINQHKCLAWGTKLIPLIIERKVMIENIEMVTIYHCFAKLLVSNGVIGLCAT